MGVSVLPGPKPMQGDIMTALNAIGRYERERQDVEMRDAMWKASTEPLTPEEQQDPNGRYNHMMKSMSGYRPKYANGIMGAFQRFGSGFAPPSDYRNQLGDMFLAQATPQAQAELERTRAQTAYYNEGRAYSSGLFARDAQGNMRPLKPGETPLEGEMVVKPSARAEMDPDIRRQRRYEAAAIAQGALENASNEKDKAWWRGELDRLQQGEEGGSPVSAPFSAPAAANGQSAAPASGQKSLPVDLARDRGIIGFGRGILAGLSSGRGGGQQTQSMQTTQGAGGQGQGGSPQQLFGQGGGLAGFGNGVAGGLTVGNWNANSPGQQTPSGTDESGHISTMKAQEGGGVVTVSGGGKGKAQQAPATMADFKPNMPPQIMQMIQQALANGYSMDQIKATKEVQPYLKGAK